MRRGELLRLTWEDVDLDLRVAHLDMTKNGSKRDVPLSSEAITLLRSLPHDISGNLFPITAAALRGLWNRACRRAGITDLHFHDLRHEATSRFFEKGLNVMEVATITGHKDLRMLQRYTHWRHRKIHSKPSLFLPTITERPSNSLTLFWHSSQIILSYVCLLISFWCRSRSYKS
jgi:integrase